MTIAKGPKVGRLFPIHFFISPVLSFTYIIIDNKSEICHKHLEHPNSNILSHFLNFSLLDNKNSCSNIAFDYSTCKLGKIKTLPFLSIGRRAAKYFDVIHNKYK